MQPLKIQTVIQPTDDAWYSSPSKEVLSHEYFGDALSGQIKVWNGTSFVAKPVKVWDGSIWTIKPLKRWTGTDWLVTPY